MQNTQGGTEEVWVYELRRIQKQMNTDDASKKQRLDELIEWIEGMRCVFGDVWADEQIKSLKETIKK